MVARIETVEAVECDSPHEAAWLERNLLRERRPRWNRSRGEEVPVYLRLDGRPRSPGLSVVHRLDRTGRGKPATGVHFFGPYLGSVRAQLAVAGLQRVLPLAYTADGLSSGQVDLARMLGVDALDRAETLATLRRVLDREPDAVRLVDSELQRRRDAAAHALAFERAGQIQAESDALDWLVSEQKMATIEPVLCNIAGWADGTLVRFAVREGILFSWTQQRCSEATAQPHLASTPPQWTVFAERSARLAATLAEPEVRGAARSRTPTPPTAVGAGRARPARG
jgi:excinuclease ABC subunit C